MWADLPTTHSRCPGKGSRKTWGLPGAVARSPEHVIDDALSRTARMKTVGNRRDQLPGTVEDLQVLPTAPDLKP